MRRKLLLNCSEASKLASSSKRSKSDAQESPTEEQTGSSPKEEAGQVAVSCEPVTSLDKARLTNRKMVTLFISYNGYGYHGMQFNANVKTIEGELLEAICKAGATDKETMYQLGKLG